MLNLSGATGGVSRVPMRPGIGENRRKEEGVRKEVRNIVDAGNFLPARLRKE